MFIKLTRLNGAPIWINGAYVVTVEKGRQVGAVVVPIGDGLDYDVKETPEQILAMIDGKVEKVVPVPASDALTLGETGAAVLEAAAAKEAEAAKAEPVKSAAVEAKVEVGEPVKSAAEIAEESAAVAVEAVKAVETAKTAKKRSTVAKRAVKSSTKAKTSRAKKPVLDLDEKQIERLIKQKPGTKKRLINTLESQFKTASSEATVAALIAHGVVKMDENEKIDWQ